MVRVHFGPPLLRELEWELKSWMIEFYKGLESRLLETVLWTVSTGVAFPQKSESILAHHFLKCKMQNAKCKIERLTEAIQAIELFH